MRVLFFLIIVGCTFFIWSCGSSDKKDKSELLEIEGDFIKWWTYYNENINLSSDFKAFDEANQNISKQAFLEALTTGVYLPVKTKDEGDGYRLYLPEGTVNEDIYNTMIWQAKEYLRNYEQEGITFPDTVLKTLDGVSYNKEQMLGNYVVVKCWFLACKICIEEMPELNKMKEQYADRTDVIYLALAFDDEEPLRKFLTKKKFDYETVSVPQDFLENELLVSSYPTHIVVGKDGKILKVMQKEKQLKDYLASIF
jgi:peroxiredoxin